MTAKTIARVPTHHQPEPAIKVADRVGLEYIGSNLATLRIVTADGEVMTYTADALDLISSFTRWLNSDLPRTLDIFGLP